MCNKAHVSQSSAGFQQTGNPGVEKMSPSPPAAPASASTNAGPDAGTTLASKMDPASTMDRELSGLSRCAASFVSDYAPGIRDLLHRIPPGQLQRVKNRRKTEEEAKAFFWSHVQIGTQDQCWPWHGPTTPVGNRSGDLYGRASVGGKLELAHRHAYRLMKGEIGKDQVVRHTCDTFLCCNPHHLITGTPQENMNDAVERGRIPRGADSSSSRHPESRPRGESSGAASLTTLDVHIMRWLYYWGWASAPLLARIYEVTDVHARFIVNGTSWSHVNTPGIDVVPEQNEKLTHFYVEQAAKQRAGSKNGKKLVQDIRLRAELGWSYARIAEHFKLSPSHVSRVVRGESWSGVE